MNYVELYIHPAMVLGVVAGLLFYIVKGIINIIP